MLLLEYQRSSVAENLEKGILVNTEQTNLVNVRSSKSNRGKERHMEDDRRDQRELGTNKYNFTAPVRTEEEGGWESRGQSKEGNGGGTKQKVRRGLLKEVGI